MKKRIISCLLLLALLLPVGSAFATTVDTATDAGQDIAVDRGMVAEEATDNLLYYRDMPKHWAAHSAGRLGFLDKIVGQQADNRYYFYPEREITRGEFAIWLCAVMDIEPTAEGTLYADADIPRWMCGFVDAVTEEGIVEGEPASRSEITSYFYPHRPITRIEAIRMLSIALGVDGHDDNLAGLFHDIDAIPGWGKNNVKHLSELKIIVGDRGYLHPTRHMTRGEAAELLYKAYKEMRLPHYDYH